jgi:magnesium-transporting ATPase (P-type)
MEASGQISAGGLTTEEARRRLQEFGANCMPDTASHPLRNALAKFWAPVPWLLEATIVLELLLGRFIEAGIIAALLVFNAALGFFQESRAQATLAALKSRLALNASVRRDDAWRTVPAADLVPGDIVTLSLGGVVAADVRIASGEVLLDQLLMVIIMITGDFLGMSLTTDRVRASRQPNAWRIGNLTIAGLFMGIGELMLCALVLTVGIDILKFDTVALQTLAFVAVVFGNQATTYNNRARGRLWSSRPSLWLIVASAADILIASGLAVAGMAMKSIPAPVVLGTLAAALGFAVLWDFAKVPVFARLNID